MTKTEENYRLKEIFNNITTAEGRVAFKRATELIDRCRKDGLTTMEAELFWGKELPVDLNVEVIKAALAFWDNLYKKSIIGKSTKDQLFAIQDKIIELKTELQILSGGATHETEALRADILNPTAKGHTTALSIWFKSEEKEANEAIQREFTDFANLIPDLLFDKQKEVFNDQSDTILAICSRNAGKSYLMAAKMLDRCLRNPNTMCAYFASTFEDARDIIVPSLTEIISGIGLILPRGYHPWRLPNGSSIQIKGLINESSGSKKRGQNWSLCVLDEVGHMPNYEDFIAQVVRNNLLKHGKGSQLLMIGTPPDNPGTWMEDMWNNPDNKDTVSKYYWTARDNPFFIEKITSNGDDKEKAFDKEKEKEAKRLGIPIDHPLLAREFDGLFKYDTDNRVWPIFTTFDPKLSLPNWRITRCFIGIDFGWSAYNAIVGIAWSDDEQAGYIFSEYKFNKLINLKPNETMIEKLTQFHSETQEKAVRLMNIKNWRQIKTYADTSDKLVADYIIKNSRIKEDPSLTPIIGFPNKDGIKTKIDKMNILLRKGQLLIPNKGLLQTDFEHARWVKDKSGFLTDTITSDDTGHADVAAALLYGLEEIL